MNFAANDRSRVENNNNNNNNNNSINKIDLDGIPRKHFLWIDAILFLNRSIDQVRF